MLLVELEMVLVWCLCLFACLELPLQKGGTPCIKLERKYKGKSYNKRSVAHPRKSNQHNKPPPTAVKNRKATPKDRKRSQKRKKCEGNPKRKTSQDKPDSTEKVKGRGPTTKKGKGTIHRLTKTHDETRRTNLPRSPPAPRNKKKNETRDGTPKLRHGHQPPTRAKREPQLTTDQDKTNNQTSMAAQRTTSQQLRNRRTTSREHTHAKSAQKRQTRVTNPPPQT